MFLCCLLQYHGALFEYELRHLVKVRLPRLVLGTLLLELSLHLSPLFLDLVLASFLLCRKPEPYTSKYERD